MENESIAVDEIERDACWEREVADEGVAEPDALSLVSIEPLAIDEGDTRGLREADGEVEARVVTDVEALMTAVRETATVCDSVISNDALTALLALRILLTLSEDVAEIEIEKSEDGDSGSLADTITVSVTSVDAVLVENEERLWTPVTLTDIDRVPDGELLCDILVEADKARLSVPKDVDGETEMRGLTLTLTDAAALWDVRALPLELKERYGLALTAAEEDNDGVSEVSRVGGALCEINREADGLPDAVAHLLKSGLVPETVNVFNGVKLA